MLPQFRHGEIKVPFIQGGFKEDRTYIVRYRPVMDEILRVIEDPDVRGILNLYPERHYVRDPHGGPNMRVWTDVHTADDWWTLQVSPPHSLCSLILTLDSRTRLDRKRLPSTCDCTLTPRSSARWG